MHLIVARVIFFKHSKLRQQLAIHSDLSDLRHCNDALFLVRRYNAPVGKGEPDKWQPLESFRVEALRKSLDF